MVIWQYFNGATEYGCTKIEIVYSFEFEYLKRIDPNNHKKYKMILSMEWFYNFGSVLWNLCRHSHLNNDSLWFGQFVHLFWSRYIIFMGLSSNKISLKTPIKISH